MWRGLDDDSLRDSLVKVFCENGNGSYYIRYINFVS